MPKHNIAAGKAQDMDAECAFCCEKMPEYIDGTVDAKTHTRIEEHLIRCSSCREEYHYLSAMRKLLPPVPELPENFQQSLHQKLVAASEELRQPQESKRIRIPYSGKKLWKILVPAAACIALSLGVFTTGLYQRWMDSDEIWNTPESAPSKTAVPVQNGTPETETEQENPRENAETVPETIDPTQKPETETVGKKAASAPETRTDSLSPAESSKAPMKTESPRPAETKISADTKAAESKTDEKVQQTEKEEAVPRASEQGEKAAAPAKQSAEKNPETEPESVLESAPEEAKAYAVTEERAAAVRSSGAGGADNAAMDGSVAADNGGVAAGDIYRLRVSDVGSFLEDCRENTGLQWQSRQSGSPEHLIPDCSDDAVALRLSATEWSRMRVYAEQSGTVLDLYENHQNQSEILVVITR